MKTKLVLASFAALSFAAFAHAQAIALAMDPSVGRLPELVVFDLSPAAHRSIGVLPELVVFDRSPAAHRSIGVLPELVVYANRLQQHRVDAAQGARDLRAPPINGRSSSQSQTSTAASPALATQPSAADHDSSAKDDSKTGSATAGT